MTERNPILQSLFNRKSVRVYEEKPIPAEMKQAILEAAAQAPSAGCQQLYTILDITDPALKEALAESCDHQPFIAKTFGGDYGVLGSNGGIGDCQHQIAHTRGAGRATGL